MRLIATPFRRPLTNVGLALICGCAAIRVARKPEPRLWTPHVLSTDNYESSPSFSPDGGEIFFMRADRTFQNYRLLWARCMTSGWSVPEPPPFAAPSPVMEGDPFVTAHGRRVYFISSRHAFHGGRGNDDLDIWYADRLPDGAWSSHAERLPEPVNSPGSELLPRMTMDGTLYFGSDRPGGLGGTDIYTARENRDGSWSATNLGSPVNSSKNEYEAEVSQDGEKLLLVADRGDRSHLYLFTREGQRADWVERTRLPALPSVFQVGPLLSPRGDRVLFAQAYAQRSGEIFLLDLTSDPSKSWPPTCPRRL
jgi:Tol biopolymer transport system component